MLTTKILKKNRGEGKTQWLVQKALIKEDAGISDIYYVGSSFGYKAFCDAYERIEHRKCKIALFSSKYCNKTPNNVYLTDELTDEIANIDIAAMRSIGGTWYATMSGELFVEE